MPGLDGPEILNTIEREALPTRVIFLSAYLEGAIVYAAVAAGAAAYLSKEASQAEICDAVTAVARGETLFSPEVHADGVTK